MRRLLVAMLAVVSVVSGALIGHRVAPAASVSEVLIGSVLPLTGNFASLGQQYLWASQTVEDFATTIAWHDDNHLDQLRRALDGRA